MSEEKTLDEGFVRDVLMQNRRMKAELEFKEQVVVRHMADWLESIGQHGLAKRIDPRQDNEFLTKHNHPHNMSRETTP